MWCEDGFLLGDALISVFSVIAVSLVVWTLFGNYLGFKESVERYEERNVERFQDLFGSYSYCGICRVDDD